MKPPAVAGAEDHGGEVVAVGDLFNESVAKDINAFLLDLTGEGRTGESRYVGASAFLIFALKYRLRVRVWYGLRCEDLLAVHAPWANTAISNNALCHAVCCHIREGGVLAEIENEAQNTNHWVAAYPEGGHVPNLGEGGPVLSLGEGESEVTATFCAKYLSVELHIAKTVADGDCGLDVMCLMLAWKRSKLNRDLLRLELAAFALKHMGNRAFVAMLHGVGELRTHLGLVELDSAGKVLLADELHQESLQELHHGDGAAPPAALQTLDASARHFSDEEILAMRWKCRLQKASPEFVIDMLQRIPEECIRETTEAWRGFQIVEAKKSEAVQKRFLISRDANITAKTQAVKSFLSWCREKHGTLKPKHLYHLERGQIPHGWFSEYVKAHPQLRKASNVLDRIGKVNRRSYVRILKLYGHAIQLVLSKDLAVAEQPTSAVAEQQTSAVEAHADVGGFAKFRNGVSRMGQQYFSGKVKFQRDSNRRRAYGAGRPKSCIVLRDQLMLWYSTVRHSVDVKIMCRFPKQVLLVKAQMLQLDYYTACLKKRVEPEHVQVDGRWLNELLAEYRLSSRKPNRKFKVPRWVLAERLMMFWLAGARVRKLAILTFGYDPVFRNVDQSPFHGNEAGSAACNTIALQGAPTVPLIENHAATRDRVSLNSVTDSSPERISQELPGFELMFRAEGKIKEKKLAAYVASKGLPFKVSVVTGPSGSYREHDILDFLEKWLLPWGPGRQWEFFCLDAYAPGLTDNVQRLCWSRGYIELTHGGGASMVAQTNDTDHHAHVRKRFIELQTHLMIKKARSMGGGMVDLNDEENIDIMIEVMSDRNLHLQASVGYKYTGTNVALDGSEDTRIVREAKDFWQELKMRKKIDAAVAEVETNFKAGLLPWTFKTVKSLIPPYPRRGHLDVIKLGQEDEATPDPDGVPWDTEQVEAKGGDATNNGDANEELDDVPEFDADDWVDPEASLVKNTVPEVDAPHHGDGDGRERKENLNDEQADAVIKHSTRLRSLTQAKDIFKEVGGALGASLNDTVTRVIHTESKRFNTRMRADQGVCQELQAGLDAEEAYYRRERVEFQEHMERKRETGRVKHELKDALAKLQRARKEQRSAEAVVTAMEEVKAYSIEMLGKGKKNAGNQQHRKARLEVLERLRRSAELSAAQTSAWDFFKTTWDQEMATAHGENWAELFAQLVQKVLNDLAEGRSNALSVFMHNETRRVLSDTPALLVPGAS